MPFSPLLTAPVFPRGDTAADCETRHRLIEQVLASDRRAPVAHFRRGTAVGTNRLARRELVFWQIRGQRRAA